MLAHCTLCCVRLVLQHPAELRMPNVYHFPVASSKKLKSLDPEILLIRQLSWPYIFSIFDCTYLEHAPNHTVLQVTSQQDLML